MCIMQERKPSPDRSGKQCCLNCHASDRQRDCKWHPHSIVFSASREFHKSCLVEGDFHPLGFLLLWASLLNVIKERRERSNLLCVSARQACQISMRLGQRYSGRITLWANKEDNQLPSKAVSSENGLQVKCGSQRKLWGPSFWDSG